MPYQNEFAKGDSLWRLLESRSVQEFKGVIRYSQGQEFHALPARLDPQRGVGSIKRIVAIDGSTVTHQVRNGYPGAEAALLNLAAIVIRLQAMRDIPRNYIPSPTEMREMERCRTLSAVLPGRNIVRQGEPADSPKRFFRATIHKELQARLDPEHETLLETLRAITAGRTDAWIDCPAEDCLLEGRAKRIVPKPGACTCKCPQKEMIYETDLLRAHERFEENGSSEQAFTAIRSVIEHLTLVNILRYFERTSSLSVFRDTAFIMDGPLALFGMPAWLKYHIEPEIARLHNKARERGDPGILLIGIEKSGQFLDHLAELDWLDKGGPRERLPNRTTLAPDMNYIHKHIVLQPLEAKPYGEATYYGRKVLYKNKAGQHAVIMTPIVNESGHDYHRVDETAYPRIGEALDILDELHTYLYKDGFAPLVRAHAHAAIPLRTGARILAEIFNEA